MAGGGRDQMAQVTGWYQKADNRQYSAEDRNTAADRTPNTFANRVIGLSAELHSNLNTGPLSHAFIYGADASFTRQQGCVMGPFRPRMRHFPPRLSAHRFYAGRLLSGRRDRRGGKVLTLYPVLRFDHYRLSPKGDGLTSNFTGQGQSGSRVSPKIGARVKLGLVSVFGNYAQGFKAPPTQVNQFFENLAFGYTSVPNPNLKPETSETFEGGIRIAQGGISAGITGFTGRYRDFISQQVVSGAFTPSNPAVYQFINLNRVRISGAEGEWRCARAAAFPGAWRFPMPQAL
jgi:hemoglobin/transferrin/lactoferrin receptor protein